MLSTPDRRLGMRKTLGRGIKNKVRLRLQLKDRIPTNRATEVRIRIIGQFPDRLLSKGDPIQPLLPPNNVYTAY